MIRHLHIVNFAIIKEIQIDFKEGITVFTGETGAGKSILMDALMILLGQRASLDYIRSGEKGFLLEALFDYKNNKPLLDFLKDNNIDTEEENLIISRRLDNSSKGKALINGTLASLRTLREIGFFLLDIYGQNESQRILQAAHQEELLDNSSPKLYELKKAYKKVFLEWQNAEKKWSSALDETHKNELQRDILLHNYEEITAANLSEQEDENIKSKLSMLEHRENISNSLNEKYEPLNTETGAQNQLSRALKAASVWSRYDSSANNLHERICSLIYEVEDLLFILAERRNDLEFSPQEMNHLQNREHVILDLKRKYGESIADILSFADKAKNNYDSITNSLIEIEELSLKKDEAAKKLEIIKLELNEMRHNCAVDLCKQINEVLYDLEMPNTRLEFMIKPGDSFTTSGAEKIELFFSANKGEEIRTLSKIASGGELSRLALAIKSVAQENYPCPTLIFDEIDVGISGVAAMKVAACLKKLAASAQILCVTHLPQTTSVATQHFHLSKELADGRTITCIKDLNEEQHLEEIARIITGNKESKVGIETAKNLKESLLSVD